MNDQIAFNRRSIIDLSKDTVKVQYGSVSRNGSSLRLNGRARCGFEYTFKTTGDTINTDKLQISLRVDADVDTRYNTDIAVLINIQYWEESLDSAGNITDYVDGVYDVAKIYPYTTSEENIRAFEINVKQNFIKSIYVEYVNLGSEDVTFRDVELNYAISVSQAVAETVGFDISLLGVDWYPNGFRVVYDGSDSDDKFYWNGDENDELNGINVNGVKLIYMKDHTELLE